MRAGPVEQVFTFLAYFVFGVLAGIVGTFAHRARLEVFDATLWLGWIAALVAVGLIATGLRLYLQQRLPGLAFAIGLALVVMILTTGGAGQSVVIPASPNGLGVGELWMYGSALISFIPVIWPRLPEKARSNPGRLEDRVEQEGSPS